MALGGNALLRRGEPLEAANQARAARDAARILARASLTHELVVTHGNGPQVGLLALKGDAERVLLGELERAVVAEVEFLNEYAVRKERRP